MDAEETVGDTERPSGTSSEHFNFGVLLGWRANPAGERISLVLQSAQKRPHDDRDVDEYHYFLSKEQAVLLGNYLYTLAGQTAPVRKKPRLLDRWFGN